MNTLPETNSLAEYIHVLPAETARKGIRLISSVHRITNIQQVTVIHKKRCRQTLGTYFPHANEIRVDANQTHSVLIFLHEFGHFLDYKILNKDSSIPCSSTPRSLLASVVKQMRATHLYRKIDADMDLSKFRKRYYKSAKELWARAYTQFIITRLPEPDENLEKMILSKSFQWDTEEFVPIHKEIETTFKSLGWL